MQLTTENGVRLLVADRYSLAFLPDRPFVGLLDHDRAPVAELFVPSSIHAIEGRDDTVDLSDWEVDERSSETVFTARARSSLWATKLISFRCSESRFTYEIVIEGSGRLAEVCMFGGYFSGRVRWGSGFFPSRQIFTRGFNPEPNSVEQSYFAASEGTSIDLMGVPLSGRDDWFFTPPPFCYAFEIPSGWVGIGVQATPGLNSFTEYRYHGRRESFYLELSYEGYTRVDGRLTLPAIGFDFAATDYGAIEQHTTILRAQHLGSVRDRASRRPAWWREPIFCGWGAQCHMAAKEEGRPPDYARQSLYNDFLGNLEAEGISPGTVVLDDKWQLTYGTNTADITKWPDLAGFVRGQHAAGRRVLLWLKAWDPEGVPAEECIRNAGGMPVAVDPTQPAFERRLRASVRQMLGAEGYDADGFKIDFSARIPSGPGMQIYQRIWGLELMKLYLGIVYDAAKEAKPDALIMTHTPHPYLADKVDMIRLNDMNPRRDIPSAMRHRARIARMACPDALIDTDNWPIRDKASWREYLPMQAELGVPSLYYASHVDATGEPLEPADYELIRQVWADYRNANRGVPVQ